MKSAGTKFDITEQEFCFSFMHPGTDAKVFIQIYGIEGRTEVFNLRNKTDNFETGAVDVFKVK